MKNSPTRQRLSLLRSSAVLIAVLAMSPARASSVDSSTATQAAHFDEPIIGQDTARVLTVMDETRRLMEQAPKVHTPSGDVDACALRDRQHPSPGRIEPPTDFPEYLKDWSYVIENNSIPQCAWVAVKGIELQGISNPNTVSIADKKDIADALKLALRFDDLHVLAAVAHELIELGGDHQQEGYRLLGSLLARYKNRLSDEEIVSQLGFYSSVPELVPYYGEVVRKSSDTKTIAVVAGSLLASNRAELLRLKSNSEIASILKLALSRDDLSIGTRSRVGDVLAAFGPEYDESTYKAYLRILSSPLSDFGPSGNAEYVALLVKVVKKKKADPAFVLREAIRDHYVLIREIYRKETEHLNPHAAPYRRAAAWMAEVDAAAGVTGE